MRTPTDVYLLSVVDGKPRCEAWRTEPDPTALGTGTIATNWQADGATYGLAVTYHVSGDAITFDFATHSDDGRATIYGPCGEERSLTVTGTELRVDGARWFGSAKACRAALRAGARVATDLDCWRLTRTPPTIDEATRSLQAFEALLRAGGRFWLLEDVDHGLRCIARHVDRASERNGVLSTQVWWRDMTEPRHPGRSGYNLEWRIAAPAVGAASGAPITRTTALELGSWSRSDDGTSGMATGGMHRDVVVGARDAVDIHERHYLSAAACRAAVAHERAVRRWRPRPTRGASP